MSDLLLESEYLAILEAEDYVRGEKSLSHFIRAAWSILEPQTPYLHNWHVDCMSEYLEAVELGQIRRLIMNIPPRYMKSIEVSVCYPAWVWIRNPAMRFICGSFSESLSTKHSVDRRAVIQSNWYQYAWRERFSLSDDQNQKTEFTNDHRGHMIATSVGSSAIGKGGNRLIFDDPLNPREAVSDTRRESANAWVDNFTTRLDDKKNGAIIGVMQRLHEKDPCGHLKERGDWEILCLPVEAPSKTVVVFPVSKRKITREEGSILWPDREGPKELEAMKRALGSAGYQSQYQQDPRPQAGGFFKRSWWQFYRELPMSRTRRVQFWDCAEKPGLSTDFTVCATWDQTPTGYYLVDLWVRRVTFPELETACKNLYAQHMPDSIVIEDKSAGTQLLQNLRAKTDLPVIAYNPGRKDKIVRASGAQPTVEAGNCYLPESRPWVELFISRHEKFPNDEHDDEVDTTSMMVEHFRQSQIGPRIRSL
jgi:predicted phage terminase large subunit-like protein